MVYCAHVADNPIESNAFVVHRWGSVLIHNAGNASESQPADARILSADDMAPMMSTFVSHLKSLLGIVDLVSAVVNCLTVALTSFLASE